MEWLIAFVVLIMLKGLIPEEEPNCKICNDTKEVEVLVMGTDTEMVECAYCSTKEKYKEFQESYKKS